MTVVVQTMAYLKGFVLLSSLLNVIWSQENITMTSSFSEEQVICDVADRVDSGCSILVPYSRSLVDCVSQCTSETYCIGASLDQDGQCFHHKECPFISGCKTEYKRHRHMTKYCAHGAWDTSSQTCQCVNGAFGERCNQFGRKCKDLIPLGYAKGVHMAYIDPDQNGQKPFLATCSIVPTTKFSAVQLLRNQGVVGFNKTWVEYVNGFYINVVNFWGGLYPMYRVTKAGQNKLQLAFAFLSRNGNPSVYRKYTGTLFAGESERYSFDFDGTSRANSNGDLPDGAIFGNCLNPLKGASFSAWDADHDDNADENCAANAGSGWWYTGCDNPCNILGFGLHYFNTKPRREMMSLLGVDLDSIHTEQFQFSMYIHES